MSNHNNRYVTLVHHNQPWKNRRLHFSYFSQKELCIHQYKNIDIISLAKFAWCWFGFHLLEIGITDSFKKFKVSNIF